MLQVLSGETVRFMNLGRNRQDFTDEARNSVQATRVTYSPQFESATSYRDVRGGIWSPPQNDGRHADGGHARGGHSAPLSRDCQLQDTLPLLCDSAQRARDVRLLSCDGLLLALTWGSSLD